MTIRLPSACRTWCRLEGHTGSPSAVFAAMVDVRMRPVNLGLNLVAANRVGSSASKVRYCRNDSLRRLRHSSLEAAVRQVRHAPYSGRCVRVFFMDTQIVSDQKVAIFNGKRLNVLLLSSTNTWNSPADKSRTYVVPSKPLEQMAPYGLSCGGIKIREGAFSFLVRHLVQLFVKDYRSGHDQVGIDVNWRLFYRLRRSPWDKADESRAT